MYKEKINYSAITALSGYVKDSVTQIGSLSEKITQQENQLSELKQKLTNLATTHERFVTELNADHAKKLATEIGAIEKSLKATIADKDTLLAQVQLKGAEQVDSLKNDYEQKLQSTIDTHNATLETRVSEYEQKIADMTSQYEQQITEMKAQYEEKVNALTAQVERLSVSNDAMIRRIRGLE